ncbi:MAG TPA: lipase, partial [Dietzia sp.]|nr:lipase [Dietzia sp.]
TDRRRWLHHGSSISHGSNATSPARTWPALAARLGGVDLRNLGVGGSALVDPFMARVMRDTPADLISLKLGINVTNSDSMRLRAFIPAVHGFLDTIRDGHPTTPLLLVSPIYCG